MVENYSINNLHNDCLAYIFKFLTLPERWIAAQVCERWDDVDLYDPSYIGAYDVTDPSWAYIFGNNNWEIRKTYVIEEILKKYGKYIKWLKYNDDVSARIPYYSPSLDLSHLMKFIGERLRTVKIHSKIRERELQSLAKCQRIINFQYNYNYDDISNEMEQVFQSNADLKTLAISVFLDQGNSLSILRGRSIKKLEIQLSSQDVTSKLAMVLADLKDLTSLRIILSKRLDFSNLIRSISSHEFLEKVIIDCESACSIPLPFDGFLRLTKLVELGITNHAMIEKEFYCHVSSKLLYLKCVNMSGCFRMTDENLEVLAKLPKLEKLKIDGYRNPGTGLMAFRKLKYLSCKRSRIFDRFICHVLHKCEDLQFLDVANCTHITLATIDAAVEAIDRRTTNIPLRIILDYELAYYKRIDLPPLLELDCIQFRLADRDTLTYSLSNRSVGVSRYFLNKITQFVENIYTCHVNLPRLDDSEICNILRFLLIPCRVKMKQVSLHWNELIQTSWQDIRKLDLSGEEWQCLFSNQTTANIRMILKKITRICGNSLKHVVMKRVTSRIDKFILDCPLLETISNRGLTAFFFDANLLTHSKNLTSLRMFNGDGKDAILETVFQHQQNLKSLILFNLSRFLCFSLLKLNPNTLQLLHLYRLNLSPTRVTIRNNFSKAMYRLINLRDFKITPGYVHDEFIIVSMENCKRLNALTIKHNADEASNNLNLLFKFTALEKLAIRNSDGLNDNFLQGMVERMKCILQLDITGCKNVTDDGLRAISRLPNLQKLIMEGLSCVDGTGLSSLSGNNFQHLECPLCFKMCSLPLRNILRQCPNLKFLNIAACPRLDESVIDTAIEVTDQRDNSVKLKMLSDARLARPKRGITSSLLEILIFEKENKDMFE